MEEKKTFTEKALYCVPNIDITYVKLESSIAASSIQVNPNANSIQHEWEDNQSITRDYIW